MLLNIALWGFELNVDLWAVGMEYNAWSQAKAVFVKNLAQWIAGCLTLVIQPSWSHGPIRLPGNDVTLAIWLVHVIFAGWTTVSRNLQSTVHTLHPSLWLDWERASILGWFCQKSSTLHIHHSLLGWKVMWDWRCVQFRDGRTHRKKGFCYLFQIILFFFFLIYLSVFVIGSSLSLFAGFAAEIWPVYDDLSELLIENVHGEFFFLFGRFFQLSFCCKLWSKNMVVHLSIDDLDPEMESFQVWIVDWGLSLRPRATPSQSVLIKIHIHTFNSLDGELLVLCLKEEHVSQQENGHQHLHHVSEWDTKLG